MQSPNQTTAPNLRAQPHIQLATICTIVILSLFLGACDTVKAKVNALKPSDTPTSTPSPARVTKTPDVVYGTSDAQSAIFNLTNTAAAAAGTVFPDTATVPIADTTTTPADTTPTEAVTDEATVTPGPSLTPSNTPAGPPPTIPPTTSPIAATAPPQPTSSVQATTIPTVVPVTAPTSSLPTPPPTSNIPSAINGVSPGIRITLDAYNLDQYNDPEGSKVAGLDTLRAFTDPNGIYSGAWWFNDGVVEIAEIVAVIMYAEGHQHQATLEAISARFIWYCGGSGESCGGAYLLNYLAYFHAWRVPAAFPHFTSSQAYASYYWTAHDVVNQQASSQLTIWIPGADQYIRNINGLYTTIPVNWQQTYFHFVNADPTWDTYLRQTLNRDSDGINNLWVLTMGEAMIACGGDGFSCPNMTYPRQE